MTIKVKKKFNNVQIKLITQRQKANYIMLIAINLELISWDTFL